ncbi:cation:dicarboxylate symporter family transporter [Sphingomonas sp.]|uniref:dicarboxylate/amino acid:cation symporter n=1 Tax=Sphingomonas sp. TaxID=28214 RepID=UPI00286B2912|nr:cation:dicarboxylase symporter family transporter [Sphingomonas sp.]
MSKTPVAAAEDSVRGGRAYYVLVALLLGLIAGAGAAALGDGLREPALQASNMVGGLWLNALKMTVIPLIVALLVTGVAKGAEAARAGRIAGRSVVWIVVVCTLSAIFGTLMIQFLLGLFPLPEGAAQALRAGLAGIDTATASPTVPGVADFFRGIIPENVVAAAANGDVLPLVVFSLLFALAAARIPETGRRALVGLYDAVGDASLVVNGWVLWIAPLGVFALAFTVGASAGGAAFAALAHYIVLISAIGVLWATLVGYPLAILAGGISLGSFTRSMISPQSVAISTRSSLASLPAMLAAARVMGVREQVADVTLPLSVALFRATGPAMNVAVAFYVAHWLGFEPSVSQMIAATAVAAVISYGAVSLPGEVSFISSIAPIAMALGVPIAPLALLVAVEMVPDIFRTLGNVTLDVAVTTVVNHSTREKQGRNLNAS